MEIKQNPFDDQLTACIANINELEEQLATERELKNTLLISMKNFYTNELKGAFFRLKNGKKLGQIDCVFTKNNLLFVHLYFLEITINSKIAKKYVNFELFSDDVKNLILLSDAEYKEAFFNYVNGQIRIIETEEK